MCEAYHLTPEQVDGLTIPEIHVLCDVREELDPMSLHVHAALRQRLTPQERLLIYSQLT